MVLETAIERALVTVRVTDIDFQDDLYRLSYGAMPSGLSQSLRTVGLINPPTVQGRTDGRWRIVAGFRRCALCKEHGAETIPAWCVEYSAPELPLFVWAVCDNAGVRPLNAVECATALAKLHGRFKVPKEELATRYMPLLNLSPSLELVERYLSLAGLAEPMRQWLAEDRLSHEAALELLKMAEEDAGALFALISALRLGKNHQRELIRLAMDVARRESLPINELLASAELQRVLAQEDLSPAHKTERALAWLRERRFPRLAAAQRCSTELIRRLRLPGNIRLEPPPNFEGAEWQCRIRFSRAQELQQAAQRLQEMAQTPELQQLLLLP